MRQEVRDDARELTLVGAGASALPAVRPHPCREATGCIHSARVQLHRGDSAGDAVQHPGNIDAAKFRLQARSADSEPSVYAITGAKIFTLAGAPIENGTVLIRDGKIAAAGANITVPAEAKVIDAKGLEVYPGFFDPITQTGLTEISAVRATNDISELGDFNPDIVAMTAVNPESAHIAVTRASGITEVLATPGVRGFDTGGGAPTIAGQASLLNLAGWTNEQMTLRASAAMVVNWPSIESRNFDYETGSFNERPYSEVKAEYDKKVYALGDLSRTRAPLCTSRRERIDAEFRARSETRSADSRGGRKASGARGGANSPRHPQFRRILQQAEFENDFGRRHGSVASKRSAQAEKYSRNSRPDHERAK